VTLLDDLPVTTAEETGGSQEALFKEARQRRRRRWAIGLIALLLVSLGALIMFAGGIGGGLTDAISQGNVKHPGSPITARPDESLQAVGSGLLTNALDCVSKSACFAVVYPQPGDALHDGQTFPGVLVAKTQDGGASWMRISSFPRHWSPQPVMSCPTPSVCVLAVQPSAPHNNQLPARAIATTRDGGSSWAVHPLPLTAAPRYATVRRIDCFDDLHCLAYVSGQDGSGLFSAFLSTGDGGTSWSDLSDSPISSFWPVLTVRCEADGNCIALAMGTSGGLTLRSSDLGSTWTQSSQSELRSSPIMISSCGDALHCVYSTDGGGLAFTSNGGQSWSASDIPVRTGQMITAVDCVDGTVCFAAAAQSSRGSYVNAVIYRSDDGGQIWKIFGAPARADGSSISTVTPISCPTPKGCIAISQLAHSPPHTGTKRVVISNFG
jgi:hypothetical protein